MFLHVSLYRSITSQTTDNPYHTITFTLVVCEGSLIVSQFYYEMYSLDGYNSIKHVTVRRDNENVVSITL